LRNEAASINEHLVAVVTVDRVPGGDEAHQRWDFADGLQGGDRAIVPGIAGVVECHSNCPEGIGVWAPPRAFGVTNFDKAFLYVMKESGRNFRDVTHSFTEVDGKLNLLNRDNWIVPLAGEHHWFFDVLMTSMGGGKPDNVEHIERVLAYKLDHPECIRLPALLLHGEGNIGKNLLVDSIFREIYAGATMAANSSDVVGQFNSLVAGKVIVMIDETSPRKMDHDRLKHVLHREIIEINTKMMPQYETNNLALYILSSNRKRGGIYLDRSQADRRYSVIYIEDGKDLIHWLCQRRNWTREQAADWMDQTGIPAGSRSHGDRPLAAPPGHEVRRPVTSQGTARSRL
jgi:hypothetical protein